MHGKGIYHAACYTCKICCLTFKTFCFLAWLFSLLSPSSLLKALSFIDRMCLNLLGIRMRFFVCGLYERLRNDPNTLNKISPEFWIRNIYESSSVTVASTRTIQWYLRLLIMCKCVIPLPLFSTLLLTEEDPCVNVERGRSENNAFTL